MVDRVRVAVEGLSRQASTGKNEQSLAARKRQCSRRPNIKLERSRGGCHLYATNTSRTMRKTSMQQYPLALWTSAPNVDRNLVALLPSFSDLHAQARPSIPKRHRLVSRAGAKVVGEWLPSHRVDRVHVPPEGLAASLAYHIPQSCGVIPGEIKRVYSQCAGDFSGKHERDGSGSTAVCSMQWLGVSNKGSLFGLSGGGLSASLILVNGLRPSLAYASID